MEITFITGDSYISHLTTTVRRITPVYAVVNGKKLFLKSYSNSLSGGIWSKYDDWKSEKDLDAAKESIVKHEGRYCTFHGLFDDPFELLEWVKEKGYTLEAVRGFFISASTDDYADFHGNLREYSCAFHYRIYDKEMMSKLKQMVSEMKKSIR